MWHCNLAGLESLFHKAPQCPWVKLLKFINHKAAEISEAPLRTLLLNSGCKDRKLDLEPEQL